MKIKHLKLLKEFRPVKFIHMDGTRFCFYDLEAPYLEDAREHASLFWIYNNGNYLVTMHGFGWRVRVRDIRNDFSNIGDGELSTS